MTQKEFLQSKAKPTPEKYGAFCGKKLERKRYCGRLEDLTAFKRRKYCNQKCMSKAFVKKKATNQKYRPAHQSARRIVEMELRPQRCEICGVTGERLDVHHLDGNYHNNSSANLMLVCRSCHLKQHRQRGVCSICGKPMKALGYCDKHYQRFKKYGNPNIVHVNQNK